MHFGKFPRAGSAVAAALVIGVASLRALELPNLSGKWKLNRDASDSADAAMRDAPAQGRSGGGGYRGHGGMGRGGGGMGRGGGGRRGRAAPSDGSESGAEDTSSLRDTLARARTLEIRHEEPRLSITDAIGRERVVYTDGRKTEEERSIGGTTKVRAKWKDGRVEVTSVPEKGPKITETFSVTADRSQLIVTMKLEGRRRGDITLHRTYDVVNEGAAPAPAPAPTPPGDPEDDPSPVQFTR
ncbi:MAG: hypothetical protein ABI968_13340 [Acidobacteriota bacterium]